MTLLRTIQLGRYPLRIYASPLGASDHPWASFEDLAALAEMDAIDQAQYLTKLRRDVPDMVHELSDGAAIVAEPLVGGLFQAWVMMGAERAQALLDDWTDAWTELFAAQNKHLPRMEWLRIVQEAGLRNVPMMPGVTVMQ